MNRVLFSSLSVEWATPHALFLALDQEFGFNYDPCPIAGREGLTHGWLGSVFVNPPFKDPSTGRNWLYEWVEKGYESSLIGATVVMLLAVRSDTRWWHDFVMKADEIRFIKGRLKFGESKNSAPFPSCVVVFRPPANRVLGWGITAEGQAVMEANAVGP